MNGLSFEQVIVQIKEGETYEGRVFDIEKYKGGILIKNRDCDEGITIYFGEKEVFKLKIKEIDFKVALELYYNGKKIKSLTSQFEYLFSNGVHLSRIGEGEKFSEATDILLYGDEILGKWVVVND